MLEDMKKKIILFTKLATWNHEPIYIYASPKAIHGELLIIMFRFQARIIH